MSGENQSLRPKVSKKVSKWKKGSRLFSRRMRAKWLKQSGLFSLSIFSLMAIAVIHLWLLFHRCGLLSQDCCRIFGEPSPLLYRAGLLHGAWVASLLAIWLIDHFREQGEAWRMRYAICWMILFGVTFGYVGAYHWQGLQDNQSPGQTLGAIGLAALGPATLLFVIWRGRLEGQANQIARSRSVTDQYRQASTMLGSGDVAQRVAGIALIREVGRTDKTYRRMSVRLLRTFVGDSKYGQGEDKEAAHQTINYLSDRRMRRSIEK